MSASRLPADIRTATPYRWLLCCLFAAALQGCTTSGAGPASTDPFEDVPVIETGGLLDITDEEGAESGDFYFTSSYFRDMSIGPNGHIFVSNSGNPLIYHFDGNGAFLGTLGSEGNGPGEFQTVPRFDLIGDDVLFTLDIRAMRISRFTFQDGEWHFSEAHSIDQREGYRIENLHQVSEDRLLLEYSIEYRPLLEMSEQDTQATRMLEMRTSAGEVVASDWLQIPEDEQFIFRSGGGGVISDLPLGAMSIVDTGPGNQIYHLLSRDFHINIYRPDGSLADSVTHPSFHAELSEEIRQAEGGDGIGVSMGDPGLQREMEQKLLEEIPTSAPALRDMHVDRDTGHMIVRRHVFGDEPNWMLLDSSGGRMGVFSLDEEMQVFDFRRGKIVGFLRGEDIMPTIRIVTVSTGG